MISILLHGFWGQPSDWNAVLERLPLGAQVWVPDLYEYGPQSPQHPLGSWVSHFHDELLRRFAGEQIQLVGYSMGGRLALNALAAAPERFARSLLVSAAPLMVQPREQRLAWEREWQKRFLEDDWQTLETAWQEQSVLSASKPLPRRHSSILREMLGLSLINWSVTSHEFGEAELKAFPRSVDWIFGALDQKYCEIAKFLRKLPVQGQISLVENAGHRVPQDAPGEIAAWLLKGGI